MGNLQRAASSPDYSYIRVVHANGSVQDFLSPLAAEAVVQGEHCIENRNFLLCNSSSLRVGKRPCPLHPDSQLELGNLYFVLPVRTFQSRLAWSQISSLAATATSAPAPASSAAAAASANGSISAIKPACRLLTSKMFLRNLFWHRLRAKRKGGEYILQRRRACCLAQSEDMTPSAVARWVNICDTPQVHTKYIDQLIARSNSWRPQLRTIEESVVGV